MTVRTIGRRSRHTPLVAALCLALGGLAWGATPAAAAPVNTAPAGTTPPAVLALGDSIPSGYNCDCTPYPQQFGGRLSESLGTPVPVDNLGVPGATTADVLKQLQTTSVRSDVAHSTQIIIQIGANDYYAPRATWEDGHCTQVIATCFGPTDAQVKANLTDIVTEVTSLAPAGARVYLVDYWDVFEDGAVAKQADPTFFPTGDPVTRMANATITSVAAATDVTLVDTYVPFKGDGSLDPTPLLASDGDHPDAAGHALIAATLAQRAGLVRPSQQEILLNATHRTLAAQSAAEDLTGP